jgi:hypothetical protein
MAKKGNHTIIGVHVSERVKRVKQVQQILTAHGCQIKTRLGLHDAGEDNCSPNGLLLLEVIGPAREAAALMKELREVEGVDVKKMVFPH